MWNCVRDVMGALLELVIYVVCGLAIICNCISAV